MGVTIHYRGSIDDVQRIEDLEDRVIDFALEVEADARIWRSASSIDPRRMVRGLMVNLVPGQETTSLLFSPEGWLINLWDIEDAELGRLQEPPYCFVKTQYGNVEGHVLLIEMFAALKKEFMTDLEVTDEGGYQENRDFAGLRAKFHLVQNAIDNLEAGLMRHGLSPEAAEDPQILATRIERIAQQVHRVLSRPAEHPPVQFTDELDHSADSAVKEKEWDAFYRENRRKQQRLHRAIEDRLERREDTDEAFEGALRDAGILGLPPITNDEEREESGDLSVEFDESRDGEDASWRESLPDVHEIDDEEEEVGRHPLQERALSLMLRLHEVSKHVERRDSYLETLHGGAGEMMGGLAQALAEYDFPLDVGLRLVQLKRALRGAAFARGALIPLLEKEVFDKKIFGELDATIGQFESAILSELHRVRAEI